MKCFGLTYHYDFPMRRSNTSKLAVESILTCSATYDTLLPHASNHPPTYHKQRWLRGVRMKAGLSAVRDELQAVVRGENEESSPATIASTKTD